MSLCCPQKNGYGESTEVKALALHVEDFDSKTT